MRVTRTASTGANAKMSTPVTSTRRRSNPAAPLTDPCPFASSFRRCQQDVLFRPRCRSWATREPCMSPRAGDLRTPRPTTGISLDPRRRSLRPPLSTPQPVMSWASKSRTPDLRLVEPPGGQTHRVIGCQPLVCKGFRLATSRRRPAKPLMDRMMDRAPCSEQPATFAKRFSRFVRRSSTDPRQRSIDQTPIGIREERWLVNGSTGCRSRNGSN